MLDRPAERLGVPTSTIALAWLLRRSPVIVPIPGTSSVDHLRDNISAAEVSDRLTDAEVAALTAVEDEQGATLGTMPGRMLDAFTRAIGA
ncbi:aldo/keto reductase [Mycolicibacterium smegmatis]|uniref:aldo/keto reductase n=1 Tax=Mycolicibacterium smegmatis TaxID=1772 RepID=UPI0002ABCC85|nr:aldo/keto reductase [Mycolicibacterium smegmatis]